MNRERCPKALEVEEEEGVAVGYILSLERGVVERDEGTRHEYREQRICWKCRWGTGLRQRQHFGWAYIYNSQSALYMESFLDLSLIRDTCCRSNAFVQRHQRHHSRSKLLDTLTTPGSALLSRYGGFLSAISFGTKDNASVRS